MSLKTLNRRLKRKATQTKCRYKIAAAAYTKTGNLLGYASNNINRCLKKSKEGGGLHAERQLMKKYGNKISYIIIARTNSSGDNNLPIHPCETCAKLATHMGIKIIPIHELLGLCEQKPCEERDQT